MLSTQSLALLHRAICAEGIVASTHAIDNYARIWARDAAMAGIAGIYIGDAELADALRRSLNLLATHQHPLGQMPSNVQPMRESAAPAKVSYGSIAGRVDATTWWLVAAGNYLQYNPAAAEMQQWLPAIERAWQVLDAWEINGRGLMYVPLGGNWADEYVVQGYVLYDQLLRLWALELLAEVYDREAWRQKAATLRSLLATNYRPVPDGCATPYHPSAYQRAAAQPQPYWASALSPAGYDYRWDMSSNALALLLDIGTADDYAATAQFLQNMAQERGTWLLPAFSPTITPADADWKLLSENYAYRFKNVPGHFHNGGSWAIFLGWLGVGLTKRGHANLTQNIYDAVAAAIEKDAYQFHEYFIEQTLIPDGTPNLCFTAAGCLLLQYSIQ